MAKTYAKAVFTFDRFGKFVKTLRRYNRNVSRGKLLKNFSGHLIIELRERTPVDTGRAIAGWGRAAQALGVTIRNPGRDPNRIAQGLSEGFIKISPLRIKIVNAVPYIIRLDQGWSPQNRAGILAPAMKAAMIKSMSKVWRDAHNEAVRRT